LTLPKRLSASGHRPVIETLLCGGYDFSSKYLFAADEMGFITVWKLPPPSQGLDYDPVKTLMAHKESIKVMVSSARYLITGCTGGCIQIRSLLEEGSSLPLLSLLRQIHMMDWGQPIDLFKNRGDSAATTV
jgi:hypothetical protein